MSEERIREVREKTYENLKENLAKYGKSSYVRPTGFGKTFSLTNLIKEYKKVLYLYPNKVIKNTVISKYCDDKGYSEEDKQRFYAEDTMEHITFMTYMGLIRLSDEDFDAMDYDLVILDEVHRIGADKTSDFIDKLFESNPNAHFVGATATPNRGDAFDVIDRYFDNINVFEYTLHDAFQDGMIQKPYYVYFTYNSKDLVSRDFEEGIRNLEESSGVSYDKDEIKLLKKRAIEVANLYSVDKVIYQGCHELIKDDSYLKFICFFNGLSHVQKKKDELVSWFHKSYPDYSINCIEITSEDEVTKENVDKLDSLTREDKHIDLVFCVDMLNMGYHVDDITGIIMYRCTSSDIIYIQQLGRAFSSGSSKPCIVFDIVDNIKRSAKYDTYDRDTIVRDVIEESEMTSEGSEISEGISVGVTSENTLNGVPEGKYIDKTSGELKDKWWRHANDIKESDFRVAGFIATYRELIKKTVAEPMLQRCKIAFSSHFRYWCDEHGVPFPITDKELMEVYGYDKEEFNKFFEDLVKNGNLNYPLGDASKLLESSSGLDTVAKLWNLSAEKILDELGVA